MNLSNIGQQEHREGSHVTNKKDEHDHKQVPITDCDGDTIFEVDQAIQSLIQYLYDKGIRTFNSCKDNAGGNVWVQYSLEAWMGLSSIAFHKPDCELRDFIESGCLVELLFRDDGYPDENDEYWIEGNNLIWSASVRFPKEYLEAFEEMLRDTLGET